ncbi:hypothetical protein, partial [Flammeovirga sp. SJP92]
MINLKINKFLFYILFSFFCTKIYGQVDRIKLSFPIIGLEAFDTQIEVSCSLGISSNYAGHLFINSDSIPIDDAFFFRDILAQVNKIKNDTICVY